MTLILASSSPSRRTLLERLKLPFEAIAPDIDESAKPGEGMQQLVSRLSQEKAQRVAAHHPDAFVIGCDQLVSVKDRILGKPHTEEVARTHLQWCSGQKLLSLTAMTTIFRGEQATVVIPYAVHFKELSESLIDLYIQLDNPLFCAGSIKAESLGPLLFDRCEGDDPTALIGLPLIALSTLLYNAELYATEGG